MISADESPDDFGKRSPASPNPLVNPRISKSLGADFEALKNDLAQATEFASELQKEVAVTKNDAAHFRQLFTKTQEDLDRFQESIVALRQERHSLANEVMRGRGVEQMLETVTEERDRLLGTVEDLKKCAEAAWELVQKRDAQVAELTMQVAMLKDTFRQTRERLRTEGAESRAPKTASIERFGDY